MNLIKGHIVPINDKILVCDMNFGEQKTKSGIVIQTDDGKVEGIKPRWAKVWAVGPEQKDVKVGEWVLIEHGRWTRGFEVDHNNSNVVIRGIDNDAILLVSEDYPENQ